MILQTTIQGYTVDLDTDMEGHGAEHPDRVTGCWISFCGGYDTFRASLEALMAEGGLVHGEGSFWPVDQNAIDQIESWALGHGY